MPRTPTRSWLHHGAESQSTVSISLRVPLVTMNGSGFGICGHRNSYNSGVRHGNWVEDLIGQDLHDMGGDRGRVTEANYRTEGGDSFIHPGDMPNKASAGAPPMQDTSMADSRVRAICGSTRRVMPELRSRLTKQAVGNETQSADGVALAGASDLPAHANERIGGSARAEVAGARGCGCGDALADESCIAGRRGAGWAELRHDVQARQGDGGPRRGGIYAAARRDWARAAQGEAFTCS